MAADDSGGDRLAVRMRGAGMLGIGSVLAVLALIVALGIVAFTRSSAELEFFGAQVSLGTAGVYLLGMITAAALLIGLWLIWKGLGRGYHKHRAVRTLRKRADHAEAELAHTASHPDNSAGDATGATNEGRQADEPSPSATASASASASASDQPGDLATADRGDIDTPAAEERAAGRSRRGRR